MGRRKNGIKKKRLHKKNKMENKIFELHMKKTIERIFNHLLEETKKLESYKYN